MKKVELTVTLYLKDEQDLSYVHIQNVCENVGEALAHSHNVTKDLDSIQVKHPETSSITGEFYKEV